jgi:ribosomal-protein-alanine N-acetyltransferase
VACIVTGTAGYGGTSLAAALALELEVPLYSSSTVPQVPTLFELLRSSPVGGVVECRASPPELRMGLARAGFDPSVVPVLDAAVDVPKSEVVRRALAVRTAFA